MKHREHLLKKLLGYLTCLILVAGFSGCSYVVRDTHPEDHLEEGGSKMLTSGTENRGMVKLIVTLRIEGIDDMIRSAAGLKDPSAAKEADRKISELIETVSGRILKQLAGTRYHVNRRYRNLPLIALEASPEAVSVLNSSPDVLAIQEDIPKGLQ